MKKLAIAMMMAGWTGASYAQTVETTRAEAEKPFNGVVAPSGGVWKLESPSRVPSVDPTAAADSGERCEATAPEKLTLDNIFTLCPEQLKKIYLGTTDPGPLPTGYARGRAAYWPGSYHITLEKVFSWFWWGKRLTPNSDGTVDILNNIPILRPILGWIVPSKGYIGESWIDNRKSIIFDHSQNRNKWVTGHIVGNIRDEIRMVAPNLYFGYTFYEPPMGRVMVLYFAIKTSPTLDDILDAGDTANQGTAAAR